MHRHKLVEQPFTAFLLGLNGRVLKTVLHCDRFCETYGAALGRVLSERAEKQHSRTAMSLVLLPPPRSAQDLPGGSSGQPPVLKLELAVDKNVLHTF